MLRRDAPCYVSVGKPFFRLQIYNTEPRLSRVFEIFFLAGFQSDARSPLTNRSRIVNFRDWISQVFSPAAKVYVTQKSRKSQKD